MSPDPPWDDDAGKRHWKNEVVVASLEMLSGLSTKEYAKAAQAVAEAPDGAHGANGAADESDLEAVVAMAVGRRGISPRSSRPISRGEAGTAEAAPSSARRRSS